MDIATFKRESALNRHAYEQLRELIRHDYAGQYVTLANGKLIGAASTFNAARALITELDVTPEYYMVFPAELEPDFDLAYDLAGSA